MMSRGGPQAGDWTLHHDLINHIWSEFGKAEVDIFATRENTQCELCVLPQREGQSPTRVGCVRSQTVAEHTPVRFPTRPPDSPSLGLG